MYIKSAILFFESGSGSHLRVAGKTLNSRSKLVQIAEDLKLPFSAIKDRKRELTDEVSRYVIIEFKVRFMCSFISVCIN
jgi:hypothetical protein